MKQYGYLRAMCMSFYSRQLYRDVAQNWGGGVVLYLFILLTICWSLMMIKIQPAISLGFHEFTQKVSPQIPNITIEKGIAKTPENKVYFITDPDNKETVGIIDTTGQYDHLEKAPAETKFLMTQTTIFYKDNHNGVRIQQIPENLDLEIKPEEIKHSVVGFVGFLWVLMLPFMIFVSLIYRLIQALLYAVLGKIFAALSNISLSYSTILKLTMVSITPAIITNTVLDWAGVSFHFEWLIYFVLAMAYLIFALSANKNLHD